MDGIRLHDNDSLEEYGVDKKRLVEEITRAYAHQIYIDGFFNGDPHPGILILCFFRQILCHINSVLQYFHWISLCCFHTDSY